MKKYFVALLGISFSISANADWIKQTKTDKFTDEVFYQYRSSTVDGQYLTLACGNGPRGSYYEPDVVFHYGKGGYESKPLQIKIRVDNNDFIQGVAWNKDVREGGYSINWGNNGNRNKEIVDKISKQFKSGTFALIQQGNKNPAKFSLKGFSEAYKQTHDLCQSSKMEYKTGSIWIK
ncbi:hypothetical protein [Thalassotalea piscium]|uniref:Uncharacterized protein n=1 Tax=Thalassotalea piscium TaxID=1230533 RepID=A0A7X0NIH2_9GAMM|nr:hypothetical protein [Thalassotalea piscium]MBB6544104.1 hypothetical protein [Thalassotalea piscium]